MHFSLLLISFCPLYSICSHQGSTNTSLLFLGGGVIWVMSCYLFVGLWEMGSLQVEMLVRFAYIWISLVLQKRDSYWELLVLVHVKLILVWTQKAGGIFKSDWIWVGSFQVQVISNLAINFSSQLGKDIWTNSLSQIRIYPNLMVLIL